MTETGMRKPSVKYILRTKTCEDGDEVTIPVNARDVRLTTDVKTGMVIVAWLEIVEKN